MFRQFIGDLSKFNGKTVEKDNATFIHQSNIKYFQALL